MKLAIIGASGMLGHHAASAALEQGLDLRVTYRGTSSMDRMQDLAKAEFVQADINDSASLVKALKGADAVIHAAAYYPTEPKPWQQEVATARAQMERFLNAAEQAEVQRIVYLGGAIALPKRTDGVPADGTERYPSEPENKNPYLQVKWAMDEMALQAAAKGLPVIVGIPAMTFGEYDWGPSTGQLITGIATGKVTKYVRGNRNVVYAGDAGRGLVAAALKGKPGQRYLITGSNTSMDEVTQLIAKIAGKSAPSPVPLPMAKLVGQVQKLKWRLGGPLPLISDTAIAVMSAGQHLDGSRSAAIGYKPQVSLEDSIERALAWFRKQGMA